MRIIDVDNDVHDDDDTDNIWTTRTTCTIQTMTSTTTCRRPHTTQTAATTTTRTQYFTINFKMQRKRTSESLDFCKQNATVPGKWYASRCYVRKIPRVSSLHFHLQLPKKQRIAHRNFSKAPVYDLYRIISFILYNFQRKTKNFQHHKWQYPVSAFSTK